MSSARELAQPVLERAAFGPLKLHRLGGSASTAYFGDDDFVLALTGPGVPGMPNGVMLDQRPSRLLPDDLLTIRLGPDGLFSGGRPVIGWDPVHPPLWSAAVPELSRAGAAELLAGLTDLYFHPLLNSEGFSWLARSLRQRDPALARRSGLFFTGRGAGLTPEGDDFLAGVAATLAAVGGQVGYGPERRRAWLDGLLEPSRAGRTTALASTLLELAASGRAAAPVIEVFRPGAGEAALRRLLEVGTSTGPAYAAAITATLALLAGRVDIGAGNWRSAP